MCPNELFWGITLYDIFFAAGVLAALVAFRLLSDKTGTDARLFNFCLADGVAAVIGGYLSSVLFQAFYNFRETGVFRISADTGMTFYGGLIGGATVFLLVYFVAGRFVFRDGRHLSGFWHIADTAACCVAVAHATGRIGCLMAGCCHGIHTDSVFGIYMDFAGARVLPVQLYESLFLYALFAFLTYRLLKGKKYCLPLYMMTYGVWRFFIEYLRGDDRGQTLVSFLSPSQLTAVLLTAAGAVVLYFEMRYFRSHPASVPSGLTDGNGKDVPSDENDKKD